MKEQSELTNSNRRGFIKTSGIAAAGAAFAPRLAGAFTGGDDEIKVGLVGCGGKGNSDIRQVLNVDSKVKLWAVGDAFEDKAKSTAEAHAKEPNKDMVDTEGRVFHGFDAYKNVIDSGADVVFLVTTPGFRPLHYEYAINQGKHVFMQKPCAVDAAGVRKLIETTEVARQKNLRVGVGFQRRHDPRYIETIAELQDGTIGDFTSFRAYWDGQTPWVRPRQEGQTEMEYQMRNWYYFNWLCGDHIVEQHIHNIDVCNWVMGDVPGLAQGKGGCQVRNVRNSARPSTTTWWSSSTGRSGTLERECIVRAAISRNAGAMSRNRSTAPKASASSAEARSSTTTAISSGRPMPEGTQRRSTRARSSMRSVTTSRSTKVTTVPRAR